MKIKIVISVQCIQGLMELEVRCPEQQTAVGTLLRLGGTYVTCALKGNSLGFSLVLSLWS